jgi:hypothetical protein
MLGEMASQIPTSFVPQKPFRQESRGVSAAGGDLLFSIGTMSFTASLLLAGAVFGYSLYLEGERDKKTAELISVQQNINREEIIELSALSNRIMFGKDLLENRVAPSIVFSYLEDHIGKNVRFNTLSLSLDDGKMLVEISGEAKNFNALAYQASLFAEDRTLKEQVFKDITVGEKGSIPFKLVGHLDVADVLASTYALPVSEETVPTELEETDTTLSTTTTEEIP